MTIVMNVYEAKTQLSRLLDEVERGGEVIIARSGRRVARLVAYRSSNAPRRLGLMAGRITDILGAPGADAPSVRVVDQPGDVGRPAP